MGALIWDDLGDKVYETGISNGVVYPLDSDGEYSEGFAWNGLTGVDENPSGAEPSKLYADNINYITLYSAEEYAMTIKAYTYPEAFEECDGSKEIVSGMIAGQQNRTPFGFVYKTKIGDDANGQDAGYKIHICYGCQASPSSKSYATINDSPDAIEFSWEVNTTPVKVKITGKEIKDTSVIVIDSRKFADTSTSTKLKALEAQLFGQDADTEHSIAEIVPNLPTPAEIYDILK